MNPVRSSNGAMPAERTTTILNDGMGAALFPQPRPVLDYTLSGDLPYASAGLPDVPSELLNVPSELFDELLFEQAPVSHPVVPNILPQSSNNYGIDPVPVLPTGLAGGNPCFPVGLPDVPDALSNVPLVFFNEYVANEGQVLDPISAGNISSVPSSLRGVSDDQSQTPAQFMNRYFIDQAPDLSSALPGNLPDLGACLPHLPVGFPNLPVGLPQLAADPADPPVGFTNLPDNLLNVPLDFLNECIVDSTPVFHPVSNENFADLSGYIPNVSGHPSNVPSGIFNEHRVEPALVTFHHQMEEVVGTFPTSILPSAPPADLPAPESGLLEERNIRFSSTDPANAIRLNLIPFNETASPPADIFPWSSPRDGKRPASSGKSTPKPKKREKVILVKGPRTEVNELDLPLQPHEPGYKLSELSPPRGKRRQTKRKMVRAARGPLARLKYGRRSIVSEVQPASNAAGGTIAFSVGRAPPRTPSTGMNYAVQAGTTLSQTSDLRARSSP